MRRVLYLVLAAAGVAGLAILASRVLPRRGSPDRETERRLDRCRDMLNGIEDAVRDYRSPEAAGS